MFGLIKSATRKTAIKTLTSATEDALESLFSNMEGTDALLSRLGVDRQQALDAVVSDDEVAACLEDLHSAMQNKSWRIYGDDLSDEDKDRLWKTLKRHLPALAEIVLTARLGGYGVGRYIYQPEPDGFLTIKHISNKSGELAKYVPYRDGSLVYRGSGGEETCNTDVLYLFITHRATSTNPAGEMAAARLYAPVALRKKGFVYPKEHTFVSSALIGGDLLVRATEPFSQQAWDNVWSDAQRGEPILARTNVKDYPIKLASNGAITERWLIKFVTATQFELYGERLGLVAKSDTLTDLAPTNPATGKPYFTLKAASFGGGWSVQNCIRFNTYGTPLPVWILRSVQPSPDKQNGRDGLPRVCAVIQWPNKRQGRLNCTFRRPLYRLFLFYAVCFRIHYLK